VRPRRGLSQSFLRDDNVARKIVTAAALQKSDVVLEIGSGHGILTRLIAPRSRKVLAVEIDPELVAVLEDACGGMDNVRILAGDILKMDLFSLAAAYPGARLRVIGNIPYGIATEILFLLLAQRRVIAGAVIMVQKELAERLTAGPGTKAYGIPTVLLAMHARIEHLFDVPPSCFYPRPRVMSAVISLTFLEHPLVALADEEHFARLVRAAFAQRRKTVWNNLRQAPEMGLEKDRLREIMENCGIDGERRAETLTVTDLGLLSNALAAAAGGQTPGDERSDKGGDAEKGADKEGALEGGGNGG